jgi:hypothetical protein
MKWRSNFWNRSSAPPPKPAPSPRIPSTTVCPPSHRRKAQGSKNGPVKYIIFSLFLFLPRPRSYPSVRLATLCLSIDQSFAGGLITDPNPASNTPSFLSPSLLFPPFYSVARPGIILTTPLNAQLNERTSSPTGPPLSPPGRGSSEWRTTHAIGNIRVYSSILVPV